MGTVASTCLIRYFCTLQSPSVRAEERQATVAHPSLANCTKDLPRRERACPGLDPGVRVFFAIGQNHMETY